MGFFRPVVSLLGVAAITAFIDGAHGSPHAPAQQRAPANQTPKYPFDPNTSKYCVWWIDVDGPWTCRDVNTIFGLAVEDFLIWNPSFDPSSCGALPLNRSYCVASMDFLHFPTPSSAPSPTIPGNGIATPRPIQPGMTPNCIAFFRTHEGDSCATVSAANGISLSDFLAWNPRVGGPICDNLWADVYVCVAVLGGSTPTPKPSPTVPANGVVTPRPVQEGVTDNCKTFYLVQEGDVCFSITKRFGVSLEDFRRWNPAVGETCGGLWAGTYCCVAVLP